MTDKDPALEIDPARAREYYQKGYWEKETIAERVAKHAREKPGAVAYYTSHGAFTWRDYHDASEKIADALSSIGLERGDRIAVLLPDGASVHAAFVGLEKAGFVIVGIGIRAGLSEITHILNRTGARAMISHASIRDLSAEDLASKLRANDLPDLFSIVIPELQTEKDAPITINGKPVTQPTIERHAPRGPDELFMINSTSGTTGLPKCVMHTQNRWVYFHKLAAEAGNFSEADIFLGLVPAPYGFGLWTAHFSPTLLGCPTVLMDRFNAKHALDLVEMHKVSVVCCVSTQFIMMLNERDENPRDLTSIRCMFTGGEAVPAKRAAEFEDITGGAVLQFYGSNETGALSRTTFSDSQEHRLTTAGKIIDEMQVRLFDPETGADITDTASTGQPGCKGPALCLGYWNDPKANQSLYTKDGYMLMGDIVSINEDGYLRVIGRTSEFIIRGGKNISAAAVEEAVATHPGIALAAVVPVPDTVFGERVCLYASPKPGYEITLETVVDHLASNGVSKEWYPEYFVAVDELPRSSGGKVSKAALKEDAKNRFATKA
ncbi:class I adenylate-forming enzyme family protein [Hyphococcus sp. DH-69]|uniref:class I adenylate-forming enzyme family protein n=1 Tax=Hyphococcus formosus TaxID=3143534 RepID=UPI00398B3DFF